jgi:peptidoglycan/LPS O-acetylase OafA/YrhL
MSAPRQPAIDALKVLASQLIVLHHLSTYGPVADAVESVLPDLIGWLYGYGRMAVQVFLVLGGYLAVRPLMRATAGPAPELLRVVGARYLRLVPPFAMAMVLAVLAAGWARPWLSEDLLAPAPRAFQMLAHLLLIHEWLDVGALSAGVWYVAIDFQLYTLMAVLLWLGQRGGHARIAIGLVLGMTAASLLVWNGRPELDDWAIYFFGAYGLGAAARWTQMVASNERRRICMAGLILLAGLALLLDFRPRIAVALAVALLLIASRGQLPGLSSRMTQWLASMGRTSYALFLVHFPVLLIGNAWWVRSKPIGPMAGIAWFIAIWGAAQVLAWLFERWIEAPLARRMAGLSPTLART